MRGLVLLLVLSLVHIPFVSQAATPRPRCRMLQPPWRAEEAFRTVIGSTCSQSTLTG